MKLMLTISCLLLLVSMTVSAQTDHTHSPSSAEDCAKLSPALQAVIGAMDGEGLRIEAAPKPESASAVEPGIHKLEVALRPLSEVALVGKESPSRDMRQREDATAGNTKQSGKVESLFGGFIRLTIPKDGLYRISADSAIWINVIDGEKLVERVRIAPRLRCGRIHKSLGFPLQGEKSYWLELSGSTGPNVALLVTEE
ncbi:MAG: hypothetical protein L0H94_10730 [Nitrospira sp.]|nr:hypothetical protein [Nitrospira sp.]